MKKSGQKPPKSKLTSFQKSQICEFKSANPEKSQKELSKYFSDLFRTRIPRSSIGDILRDPKKWTNPPTSEFEVLLTKLLSPYLHSDKEISELFLINTIKDLANQLNFPKEKVLNEEFLTHYTKKLKILKPEPKKVENFLNRSKNDSDSENFEEFFFFTETNPVVSDSEKKVKAEKIGENSGKNSGFLLKNKYLTHLKALKNSKILIDYFQSIGRKDDAVFMSRIDKDIEQSIFCSRFLKLDNKEG